jgi:hypothetical protein
MKDKFMINYKYCIKYFGGLHLTFTLMKKYKSTKGF